MPHPQDEPTEPRRRTAVAGAPPRPVLERGRVLIVASGAIGVTVLPEWIITLRTGHGWSVRLCLTAAADRLVSRAVLAALTQCPVEGPGWDTTHGVVPHRELAEWPDLVIVAPATTNFVGKLAHGQPDSLALTTVLCTTAPVLIAPSIPEEALARPSVRRNLRLLGEDGHHVVPMVPRISAHTGAATGTGMPGLADILALAAEVCPAAPGTPPAVPGVPVGAGHHG